MKAPLRGGRGAMTGANNIPLGVRTELFKGNTRTGANCVPLGSSVKFGRSGNFYLNNLSSYF